MARSLGRALAFISLPLVVACGQRVTEPRAAAPEANAATVMVTSSDDHTAPTARATIGKPAPDFTLTDTSGRRFRLADQKGKIVVLEWFNPDCPFVRRAHEKGSLKGYASAKEREGVVWVAINSAAAGNQGHDPARNVAAKKEWGLTHPILLDPSGEVGHVYNATNTPHIFVIDANGTLVYGGAIDNSPDAEGESPTSGGLENYVESALAAVRAGRRVATAATKAYGCSVKY